MQYNTILLYTDTGPPVILCPPDESVETNGTSAVVTYQTPTATDNSNETPTVECEPISGSTFGIAINNVTCVARDKNGNNGTCQFQAEVRGK